MSDPADHVCPVAWAEAHGLLDDSPMERSWCLSSYRDILLSPRTPAALSPRLKLMDRGGIRVSYAPVDWVNRAASVVLVGITPGHYQATQAIAEARRCLGAGLSNNTSLRRANQVAAFSGRMRRNLVSMLDGIGLHDVLDLDTTEQLFTSHPRLVGCVSAISYPVFFQGQNYTGHRPPITKDPLLRSLVVASLGAQLGMVRDALVIPLGRAARDAVELLIDLNLLEEDRCLLGFPHPSPAFAGRLAQYRGYRRGLASEVATWFS
ncbi:MAG TPA: hypothetical protein VMV09_04690 [Candidatus Saccharimonadales bacterium]|nr:hypothetical protein [Candidatus Saccharimonadales bacterium]